MRKPDTILDEVHAIRQRIYERTKDMTSSERTAYFNESGRRLAEEYGFRIQENGGKDGAVMKIPRIYLETTMFNYYFDIDRDAHPDTVTLFDDCAAGKFKPYTSTYVTDELEEAPPEKRDKMFGLIERYGIEILTATAETNALARRYINEGALPKGSLTDACHIATASVNGMDVIVSMNFSHIVRSKTIEMTAAINTLMGLGNIRIDSPMGVIDSEKVRYNRR